MKNRLGCLAALVMLGFGGWGAYRALNPPRVGGVAFNQLPPATQKERRVEAQQLIKQVEEVAKAAKKDERQPFTLTASEDQLNTLLQDRLRTEKFPIHDLRVGLSPDLVTVQGSANYQGFDVPATLSGRLSAQNGALVFQVDSLQLRGFPAPGSLKEKAEKSIGDGLRQAFARDSKALIDEVIIEDKRLTVRGQTTGK
jgi:hypothetical protein